MAIKYKSVSRTLVILVIVVYLVTNLELGRLWQRFQPNDRTTISTKLYKAVYSRHKGKLRSARDPEV